MPLRNKDWIEWIELARSHDCALDLYSIHKFVMQHHYVPPIRASVLRIAVHSPRAVARSDIKELLCNSDCRNTAFHANVTSQTEAALMPDAIAIDYENIDADVRASPLTFAETAKNNRAFTEAKEPGNVRNVDIDTCALGINHSTFVFGVDNNKTSHHHIGFDCQIAAGDESKRTGWRSVIQTDLHLILKGSKTLVPWGSHEMKRNEVTFLRMFLSADDFRFVIKL
jgi:hypothetical protein